MFAVKKRLLSLSVIYTIVLLSHNLAEAKAEPISFEEVISIALKSNFDILISRNTRKKSFIIK